jgi:hypothetical protein
LWKCPEVRAVEATQYSAAPLASAKRETSMRVTELPHVLGASEGYDPRGNILRIVTDLPLRSGTPGHNAKKLMGLRKAIERIRTTDAYLKYDHFELTNEGAARIAGGSKSRQHARH